MNIINFVNDNNIIEDKLSKIYISEACIKLVSLRINRCPRSSSQFQKVGDPWSRTT